MFKAISGFFTAMGAVGVVLAPIGSIMGLFVH